MDHVVFIVDDDPSVRESLVGLVGSMDLNAVSFESAAEYVRFPEADMPACLLLDVNLPDMNGLEFQRQIADRAHANRCAARDTVGAGVDGCSYKHVMEAMRANR